MGDDEYTFEDPPARRYGATGGSKSSLSHLLEMARSRPGVWVKKNPPFQGGSSTATYIRRRHPNFETTTRTAGKTENGQWLHVLYVRYVGEETV